MAGVPVTLTVEGERRELPVGLDLAAYRVVQEALTNALKHGGGAPTEVVVHYRADAVEVRIADRGNGTLNTRLGGSGHGLVGMRERVRMYGGELQAGRRRGGGFEVNARLPLEGEEEAALTAGRGMSIIRVLIADDQALVRAGFKMILDAEDDLDVIGEASDGARGGRARRAGSSPTSC